MTSNYVDTSKTRTVSRPCACPGEPHAEDTADVREAFGYGEKAIYRQAGWLRSKGQVFSEEDAKIAILSLGVKRWNLVRPDGSARPVTSDEISLLDEATLEWLYAELRPALATNPLPNASGARSSDGPSASAGRTRGTRKPKASTST